MELRRQKLLALSLFVFLLPFIGPGELLAQSFTALYHFGRASDGANPYAGLILVGSNLYGTAYYGGGSSQGTVFRVSTNGTGFFTLHGFTGGNDGANPNARLILVSNVLYGTTVYRGGTSAGTVFRVNLDGSAFTNVYSFTGGSGGANPLAGLIVLDTTLYGTADHSNPGAGSVFAINTDGSSFTNLYTFTGGGDGANPKSELLLIGDSLYGTTPSGGTWSGGTVFTVNTDGTGFVPVYNFSGGDGSGPAAGLVASGSTLFGTTQYGGSSGAGTVFALSPAAGQFYTLYNFSGSDDGANPTGGLVLFGNTLFGTAQNGGTQGNGTVFAIGTDGSGFKTLHSFSATSGILATNSDGAHPVAGLVLAAGTLYGTSSTGGKWGNGTVFSLVAPLPPELSVFASGGNLILEWPTNATGFSLQSTTNLDSASPWVAVSPAPVIINGQNIVTNPMAGAQQFYRLSQ
jgi:uncharacterized repeat protein (TIGR03803 family)